MRQWTMPRWWHYLHIGAGAFLLVTVAVSFVVFDVHSPWSYLVLTGFASAGLVGLVAGAGSGVDLGSRRLDGQRFAGVGTVLLGLAIVAAWAPTLVRGTVGPASVIGLLAGVLTAGFGVGALYRPGLFGTAVSDEAMSH